MTSFEDAADQVYGARPKDFVSTRAALVSSAKQSGDKDLARRISALRRPTTAAWLVNLLVRQAREQIVALLDLGAAMRRAQARLSADDLRAFTVQRQQIVRALAAQAHGLAAESGEQVSREVLHQVQDTLQAALSDPELADQVRAGRLTTALSYSGFGPAGLTLVRPLPEDSAGRDVPPGDGREAAEVHAQAERERLAAEAKQAVDLAARAVVRANRSVVTATETLSRADRELARADQAVAERQAALDEALATQARAAQRQAKAVEDRADLEDRRAEAHAELERCKRAVAGLGLPPAE